MTRDLRKIPWEDEFTQAVASFDFGDDPWGVEIDRWIKEEVPDARRRFGTDVWLYATEDDGLVGFGSLGASRWNWPLPTDTRVPISLIPAVGIDRRFWGEPQGAGTRRFSDQILDHLIFEAQQRTDRHRALGLFVHPDNHRAIRVYERAGFTRFSQPFTNEEGIDYVSMLLEW